MQIIDGIIHFSLRVQHFSTGISKFSSQIDFHIGFLTSYPASGLCIADFSLGLIVDFSFGFTFCFQ